MYLKTISILLIILIVSPVVYSSAETERRSQMKITSTAFEHEGMIPVKYSCKGEDVSPPLKWEGAPEGTKSFVLINDDPDAPIGVWDHWILFNIPSSVTELPEAVPARPELADGSRHGRNSWGRYDYGGPCPPRGIHRYFFKLYAIDTMLDMKPGARKKEILKAIESHTLAKAELMGRFTK